MHLPSLVVATSLLILLLILPREADADIGDSCEFGEKCNANGCHVCDGAVKGGFLKRKVLGTCVFSAVGTCCVSMGVRGVCNGASECYVSRRLGGRRLQDETCDALTPSPTQAPPTLPPATPAPGTPAPSTPSPGAAPSGSACPPGSDMCDDPHMQGLRGQKIDWSGVDGGWYCMIQDIDVDLHVNVRLTAPLPEEFPDRQVITGLSIVSDNHSLVIEVADPYEIDTIGCPGETSPCLANGGLRAVVDGQEVDGFLKPSRDEEVVEGITVSASNLPVECRQFGGDKIWARMYEEMLHGHRKLAIQESFEAWILRFEGMAAPDWCTRYIGQHDLDKVQSIHAVFKIVTSSVTVRLNVGTNHQGDGQLDWDGRILPKMEFWQMDVGLHGLSVEHESLSGLLGETARPVLDAYGHAVMEGYQALRGAVEDYRVFGSLGTHFALLDQK